MKHQGEPAFHNASDKITSSELYPALSLPGGTYADDAFPFLSVEDRDAKIQESEVIYIYVHIGVLMQLKIHTEEHHPFLHTSFLTIIY